jgi:excisionase family DNA binding protein
MEDRWLSVDEIADHLGIKRDTVYKWISERHMPGHKIGRLWKFNKKEVDEWVKSGLSAVLNTAQAGGAGEKDDETSAP